MDNKGAPPRSSRHNKILTPEEEHAERPLDPKVVRERLTKWLTHLSPETIEKLVSYHTELIRFNKAVNLISTTTINKADALHFSDSVLAAKMIEKELVPKQPLYDFGSGNGFPGLVIATVIPSLQVILVDRDTRKIEFLKHTASQLGLKNVSTQVAVIEDLPAKSVFNGVSRGLAPLHKGLLMTRKAFSKGGKLFHMKGDGWAAELASVPSQLFAFWSPSLLGQYKIPGTSSETAIIVTEKVND